jgi:hypothetical protein
VKKIITTATVKNEADIIESFCRYNLSYCDGMLINDNGSGDGTKEIIQKLADEGLPIYLVTGMNKQTRIQTAIDKYGADLIVPLDADEFLYHTDGINPRETLEAMREDAEYQFLWRTYLYEKEPDISLGFMPNNFTQYRNPEMENPKRYERHKKVIASKYLIKDKQAAFANGAHFLKYPEGPTENVEIETHEKLVFAHFPIRSQTQAMRKGVSNWIYKCKCFPAFAQHREVLDLYQIGMIYNEVKKTGELSPDKTRELSIDYAMLVDHGKNDEMVIIGREALEELKKELGGDMVITGQMNTSFCEDKLAPRYTAYTFDDKIYMRILLNEIDSALMELSGIICDSTQRHERNVSEILNSNTWKIGKVFQRVFRFFIPAKKSANDDT